MFLQAFRPDRLVRTVCRAGSFITNSLKYRNACKSFSQSGEDIIVDYIFTSYLKMKNPAYLDIGANHPIRLNNTYLFYLKGCRGVCVEPDPSLCQAIRQKRRRDICLNAGIGAEKKELADFYIMTSRTLNTFSKEEALRYQSYGSYKIEKIVQLPLVSIDDVCSRFFPSGPNFISIDVEGMEMAILKGLDFSKHRPEVLCIETLTYTEDTNEYKINEIINFMKTMGYFVYADTYINTIFVDAVVWRNRQK